MKLTAAEKAELLGLLNATIAAYVKNIGVAPRTMEYGLSWSAYSQWACDLCEVHGTNHNSFPKLFPPVRVGGLRVGETLEAADYKDVKKLAEVGVYIAQTL